MSVRNGVSKCFTFAGTGTGAAVLPSTSPVAVTYCGSPRAGPGRNFPYGSAAIIGTFVTSVSASWSPSTSAACFLTDAHVAMPLAPLPAGPPSSMPVETGLPALLLTYSRRNTWCDECDVYVWLWSTQGESVFVASWTSSALPRMPSGPGWFCARVRTMKRWPGGTTSPVFALPSGPSVTSGSCSRSGTYTVAPLLTVWSTPWSKNWPKNVKRELNGGDRPTSVVTLGMNSVLCDGTQFGGSARTSGGPGSGSVMHGTTPVLPWVRTGWPAA